MPRLTAIRKQALDEIMKQALFDASVAVLAEHGVEGMTMDRVASAASVAKGSLYHYFLGKKDLLQFVFAKITDPIFDHLADTVASDQPAIEKLAAHLRKLLEQVARYAGVFKLLFDDDTAHGLLQSSERRTRDAGARHLAEIFRQGVDEGVFRRVDPLMLAFMFLGLCRGFFDGKSDLQEDDRREHAHQLIMSSFLNGIATEEGRTG